MCECKEASPFLNENRIKFIDLPDDLKLLILREKNAGNVELFSVNRWGSSTPKSIDFRYIYRVKPVTLTKDTIPWDQIKPEYKWAARDSLETLWVYTHKPVICGDRYWDCFAKGSAVRQIDLLSHVKAGTCDWKDSLQCREE